MDIVLGSKSEVKQGGVLAAAETLGLSVCLETVSTASGVSAQPEEMQETVRGARNRALAAQAVSPSSIAIGIENGIRQSAHGWEDWAVIVILLPNGHELIEESEAVALPAEIVEEARRRGFQTTTAGMIYAERYGVPADDWHCHATGGATNRRMLLKNALVNVLGHLTETL